MDHLVQVQEREVAINFELGHKCRTTLHLRNLMHTMPVAFKLQTTSPNKFYVRPPNGYILPLAEYILEIILKPQSELPPTIPFSQEKFVLKTALAPINSSDSIALPERVPDKWFSSHKTQVFIDAKLKVVYIGASLLRYSVASEDALAVKQILLRHTGASLAGEDGRTALHIAASMGNLEIMAALLQFGAEIDAVDAIGRTPLWEAVCGGQIAVVRELLARGACTEVNDSLGGGRMAAIHVSATLKSVEILKELIKNGASLDTKDSEGRTALHFAVEAGRIECMKILLHAGADKDAQRADGRTALFIAAEKGLSGVAHLLLESGADMHIKAKNGQSASEVAAERGHVDVVEAIEAGEELLQAARRGNVEAVAALLQHAVGKKAWASDSAGWTALHVAAFKGHAQVVRQLLLSEGGAAALRRGDAEGHTPLHCAAEGGRMAVVELLLAMGADPLATSSRGATPAELATALGFTAIAKLLQHRASNPAINCPLQELLDTKGLQRLHSMPAIKPHRQPVSPSSHHSILHTPSATPSPHHKSLLSASPTQSTTFKVINQLPHSTPQQQLHDTKARSTHKVSHCMNLDPVMASQGLGCHFPHATNSPLSKTHQNASVQGIASPALTATHSQHLFPQPTASPALNALSPTLERPQNDQVDETQSPASTILGQYAMIDQTVNHSKEIARCDQPWPKPASPPSLHSKQRPDKEKIKYPAANKPRQYTSHEGNEGLHYSHQHYPMTTSPLLDGDEMEMSFHAAKGSMQRKTAVEFVGHEDLHHYDPHSLQLHDASSLLKRNRKQTIETQTPASSMLLQSIGIKDVLHEEQYYSETMLSSPKHEQFQQLQVEEMKYSEVSALQLQNMTPNQVKDNHNLNLHYEHCLRQNAAALFKQDQSTPEEETAIPEITTLLQSRAMGQSGEDVLHGNQHPPAASPLFKRNQQVSMEERFSAQIRLLQCTNPRQLPGGGADLEDCGQDLPMPSASPSLSRDQQAPQTGKDAYPLSASIKCVALKKPSSTAQPQSMIVDPCAGIKGLALHNPLSTAQPESMMVGPYGGIKGLVLNSQHIITSASPFQKVSDITRMEEIRSPASSRVSVDQYTGSDLAQISKPPNPAAFPLRKKGQRPHMQQGYSSGSFSPSNYMPPGQPLQSKHATNVRHHVTSPPYSSPLLKRDSESLNKEVMRHDNCGFPHPGASPPPKRDQMLQIEETQSPASAKSTRKVSWNDQNMPVFTPPLTIKQLRKPVRMPILRNSNSPSHLHLEPSEEVPTKQQTIAAGTTVEQQPKARTVTFRELFDEGTF